LNSPSILTIVGARPQFIKAAPMCLAFQSLGVRERLVHTGQHYDAEMSAVFFETLGLPEPDYHLGIGSAPHGAQTGRMIEAIERVIGDERPDLLLVYGDTNSTLAGALAAVKKHVPVAHIEAGLRSFNRRMPEEINRVLTDHLSELLFAPTDAAVANLSREGITQGVIRTGDVMFDAVRLFRERFHSLGPVVCERLGIKNGGYALATTHRAENSDDPVRWKGICEGFRQVAAGGVPVIWPVHPRVRHLVEGENSDGVMLLDPQPYLETQALLAGARVVLTDSGGLQKEAAFHGVPCVTLRDETEWVELLAAGVNVLAGADPARIASLALEACWPASGLPAELYGDGHASQAIAAVIQQKFSKAD